MEPAVVETSSMAKAGNSSPAAWFEFVLDETLLERHLAKSDAVPTAADLISLFLYQSEVSANIAREINGKDNGNGEKSSTSMQNKKITVLKLLAIKTACHLKWSLTHLENILPLSILKHLLLELLKVVDLNSETMLKACDLTVLTPEALFAVLLYHRWAVLTVVRNSFPLKPSKVPSVQVPGLLDPSVSSASMKDAVLKTISENISTSIYVLESFALSGGRDAIMPTCACIGSAVNEVDSIIHNWTKGTVISSSEMISQVSFDVGCIYFQQQNYEKADSMFQTCKERFSRLSSPVYANIDETRLHGYLCACGGILGRSAPDNFGKPLTLYQRVLASVQNNFQGLTGLLIEDLQKQELSWTFRATLEESTHLSKRLDSLYEEVLVCNTLRRALDGHVAMFDLVKTLNRTVGLVDFFVQVCLDIYLSLNEAQKENLRLFLRNLCHTVSSSTRFSQKLMSCNLATLFSETERDNLMCRIAIKKSTIPLEVTAAFPPPLDDNLKVGEMEQELLVTCDPAVVKDLVQKVASKVGNNQAVFLTDMWRLPPEIQNLITTLHVTNVTPLMCTHVLIAKARICIQLMQYDVARNLLLAADSCIKDVAYKLSKLIRWEILKVDLLQINGGDCLWVAGGANDPMIQELAKRAKACITSIQLENSDMQPTAELQCYCVAFLLNLKDWEFLSGLTNMRFSGFIQFGQLIAVLCKEVPQLKVARASASKFIEAVSLTFIEAKRSGLSGSLVTQREFRGPILLQDMLLTFITIIKEPMVLSLFVSCVTKLFNWACIEITEDIFSDYVTLWPNAMPESIELSQINAACVAEVVVAVLDHVLSVNPRHPSWLRTQADIYFAQSNHWQAMRYYLELGVVTTDYFSESVTKNVYNEQVYRRMIRCCSQLCNHTQVAILCQFLDEIDYTIAFKALQERTTTDAMDAYYDCIWDTTILEYLINLHTRKGELDKRQLVLKLIGQMELNSNNREDVLNEAARVRKSRFLRMLSRQFLIVPLYKPTVSTSVSC